MEDAPKVLGYASISKGTVRATAGGGQHHGLGAPPPSAHFQLFGGRQYIVKKTSRHGRLNHLTSNNVDFVCPDNGNVNLIWRISAETTAKISWGLVTPC